MNDRVLSVIITDPEGFKELKQSIENNRAAMLENFTDPKKTKEIAKTLDKLYMELGVLCANCSTETWIR